MEHVKTLSPTTRLGTAICNSSKKPMVDTVNLLRRSLVQVEQYHTGPLFGQTRDGSHL